MGNPAAADANFGCPLWLAAYRGEVTPDLVPKAWAKQSYAIHQHTQAGTCAGSRATSISTGLQEGMLRSIACVSDVSRQLLHGQSDRV